MTVKLLTEQHSVFLSFKCSSKSTLVKMPHCWKSHVAAQYRHARLQTILSGVLFCCHQRISQRVIRTSLKKQLDQTGSIATRGDVRTRIFKATYSHLWLSGGGGAQTSCIPICIRTCIVVTCFIFSKLHVQWIILGFILFFSLFDLILYVSSTIFQLNRDGSSWVKPVLR